MHNTTPFKLLTCESQQLLTVIIHYLIKYQVTFAVHDHVFEVLHWQNALIIEMLFRILFKFQQMRSVSGPSIDMIKYLFHSVVLTLIVRWWSMY